MQTWLDTESIEEVEKKQDEILLGYQKDFVKYADTKDYHKIFAVWQYIPVSNNIVLPILKTNLISFI